ncbi:MAG: hypothetical protein K2X48_16075 [Chitinophagaceae bacterium]|nr:hypothetical protein [Chitinophagaceae bacterium]
MCLVYNFIRFVRAEAKNFFLLNVLLTGAAAVNAQNVSSPYSILGIGDVDTKDFGRYFATGNASIARRDYASYNFSNPASLTSLPFKTMNFDIAFRGRSSRFRSNEFDSATMPSNDFIVKRITGAFKVSDKAGFAVGLKPYSSVNYQYNADKLILDGSSSYTKFVEGSGGINQVYVSYGYMFGKHLSAGITASWLFGSVSRETVYAGNNINLLLQKNEVNRYSGGNFTGGLQYHAPAKKKWQHTIGVTFSGGTNMRGQQTVNYVEDTATVKTDNSNGTFRMPVSVSMGYSATLNNAFVFSGEANYYNWPYQKLNLNRSFTNPSARFSAGMEYSKKVQYRDRSTGATTILAERYYLGWGVSAENSYMHIKNKSVWDYSTSVGAGYNLSRSLSVYSGLEYGKKGSLNYGQIRENYLQFIVGLTLKDIWIGPKYTRKYD